MTARRSKAVPPRREWCSRITLSSLEETARDGGRNPSSESMARTGHQRSGFRPEPETPNRTQLRSFTLPESGGPGILVNQAPKETAASCAQRSPQQRKPDSLCHLERSMESTVELRRAGE